MPCKVVYEKRYPIHYPSDGDPDYEEAKRVYKNTTFLDGESFLKRLYAQTVRVLIPGRAESLDTFLHVAKRTADHYEMDIVIMSHDDHYSVSLNTKTDFPMSGLKTIMQMADDIMFTNEEEKMVITFSFYTHTTYLSGRKISPTTDDIDFLEI